jgi:acetyl esterase/lipase
MHRQLRTLAGRAALALATLLGAAAASAQAPVAPPPAENFFAWPDMTGVQLSPSGRHLAVLVPSPTGRNLLAVVDLADRTKPRGLASYTDSEIVNVNWVGDDWLVYQLMDLKTGGGEQFFTQGLFSVARAGGTPRELIRVRGDSLVSERVYGVDRRLEYNHSLLFVPKDDSREVIVGEWKFNSERFRESVSPWRLNVETGQVRPMDTRAPIAMDNWIFDDAGEPRVACRYAQGRLKVYWRDKATRQWSQLLDADGLAAPWLPNEVDRDGNLNVTQTRGAGGTRVLARYDFERQAPALEPTVTVPGFDFNGGLVNEFKGGHTLGVRTVSDAEVTFWFDAGMKAVQEEVDRRLPGRINRLQCRRCTSDDVVVLVTSWSDRDPGRYFVMQGRQGKLELIGQSMKGIDPARMAALDFERIRARDGRNLPLWITAPRRAKDAPPPPAVVLVHGGPFLRGNQWEWNDMPQFLASRGYVVLEPEFRGSTGYGFDHFRAGWKQWGQAMQDDVADAVRWAVANKRIDGQRVCIVGGSYGGYSTLMGLVRDPDLYRCGVAIAAVSEPRRMLESSWRWADDISDDARRYGLRVLLGDPIADAEMLEAISPVQQAARIKAPLLLVHGEADVRVPFVHALEMREALRKSGREPEWFTFPDEGHGWIKAENRRIFALKVEDFLARHLKVQGAPITR